MDKINNRSPLRYPGGKTRACKKLDAIMKEHFDVSKFNNIVSPFFGGGSFEFYIQNNYNLNIIANDKFTPLYNFWDTCKLNKENLCKELNVKINKTTESLAELCKSSKPNHALYTPTDNVFIPR